MTVDRETVVSLSEFCAIKGVPSEPTMRKIIESDASFPLVERGKNGQAYKIPLGAALDWLKETKAREQDEAQRRSADIRQFGLELLGPDAATIEADGMTPREQRDALEAEMHAIRLGRERGELVRAADVEAALGEVFTWFQQAVLSISGRVAKKAELPRELRVEIDAQGTDVLNELADRLAQVPGAAFTPAADIAADQVISDSA